MITYATKPKEVRDRLKREQTTHLGTDLLENEEDYFFPISIVVSYF